MVKRRLQPICIGMSLISVACGSPPQGQEDSPTADSDTPTMQATIASTPTATATPVATPTPTDEPRPTRPDINLTPRPTDTPPETEAPTPTEQPTPEPTATPDIIYQATIRETTHGIPHILADDLGSAGFGSGYAFAKVHLCTIADQIVKVRSERSKYFGAGTDSKNLDSDFGYLALNVYKQAQELFPQIDSDIAQSIRGYKAGINQYIADTPPEQWPSACAGAEWVKPISSDDLFAYYMGLALMSSGQALIPGIARAFPPDSPEIPLYPAPKLPNFRESELGSNGWAIGSDQATDANSMLMANPHFPWEGELRFFENHITVPGVIDAYGGSLLGSSAINIGFNANIAWTHTVSTGSRMTFYELALDPTNPVRYRYDGEWRNMEATAHSISVKQEDGSILEESRTLYRTHWGPMVSTEEIGWGQFIGLTFRDANAGNNKMLAQFLRMNMATDLDSFQAAHREEQGIPWVNTIAIDKEGSAFYVDSSAVPNLGDSSLTEWKDALASNDALTVFAWSLGVPLLDGSVSSNEWVEVPGVPRAGLVPYDDAPKLVRKDFVFNANDSHWLSNPKAPLEGFSPLYGSEGTARSPRTRLNAMILEESGANTPIGEDGKFTLDELQEAAIDNRNVMAELLLNPVVDRCDGQPVVHNGEVVEIDEICTAIWAWNGRFDLDSRGAAAWREFIGYFESADLYDSGTLFSNGFDPLDPISTPYGLSLADTRATDPILQGLAFAAVNLELAGIDPDARLGDVQFTKKGDERIPLHGGNGLEGASNIIVYSASSILNTTQEAPMERGTVIHGRTDLTEEGYVINYGTSFIMALEFNDEGPRGRAFLSYSQNPEPQSPNFADQTHLFSQKSWRDIAYTEAQIMADPNLVIYEVSNQKR